MPLNYQRCEHCAAAIHPPRVACPRCGSRSLVEGLSAGRGTVYSTTMVHTREGSHDVSLVDLEEGFRVMSTVLAEEVGIGMAVRAGDDDQGRVVFTARDG